MASYLIVGLGNPGPDYAGNRHNVGQMVLDVLASDVPGGFSHHKSGAQVLDGRLGTLASGAPGPRVLLAKPTSYMNRSGGPVAALVRFFDVAATRLLVVHDELDLPFGTLRLKRNGGEGGHNGLKSISGSLGTRDYMRLRVGVGRPPGRMDPAQFVLRDFSSSERAGASVMIDEAADAVREVVEHGLLAAQERLHAPK